MFYEINWVVENSSCVEILSFHNWLLKALIFWCFQYHKYNFTLNYMAGKNKVWLPSDRIKVSFRRIRHQDNIFN